MLTHTCDSGYLCESEPVPAVRDFLDLGPRVFVPLDLVQVIAVCVSYRADTLTSDDVLNVTVQQG